MANEIDDRLSIRIGEKLLAPFLIWTGRSILKVPKHVRDVNERAYEPQAIAIGPYHRGKSHLMAMEEYKKMYLKMLLLRTGETDVTRYVKAMRALEREARNCYADFIELGTDEFVEMMVFDGCFIVELIRNCNGITIDVEWILAAVFRDLLLVENQLPFFVLEKLFEMTWMPNESYRFHSMLFPLIRSAVPEGNVKADEWRTLLNEVSVQNFKHLVGFLHHVWCPSRSYTTGYWEFIRCATELKEAGIKFKKGKVDSLFEITFEDGVMEVPRLEIEDKTETIFRNLIAYEQFFLNESINYVTDYIKFMDSLINSPKDVELLCQCGIIHNWLGDEEVVANMFNRLGDFVNISSDNFYYTKLFNDVKEHYGRRCNKQMANLRHNYFNTPWALISFLAAVFLLLFTLLQTLFSILAYFK